MSKFSAFLKPLPLSAVAVILVIAAVVFFTRSNNSGENSSAEAVESRLSSKSTSRPHALDRGPSHDGKSEGKSDEERYLGLSPEEFQEVVANISENAREELELLRAKYATEYDDPEARKAFARMLGQIADPQEKQKVLRERTAEMRRARQRAEASKSPRDRAREKELIALMQLNNLSRMSEYVAKNPDLTEDAQNFDTKLVQWVRNHESMSSGAFHQSFNKLRAEVTALRTKHAALRKDDSR